MAFFTLKRKTHFAESDAAGVIHFSRFAVYVEEAEHECLASLNFPVDLQDADALHWPRVHFEASFMAPCRPFADIRVELDPSRVGESSIEWAWTVTDEATDHIVAKGVMKTVCCKADGNGMVSCPLPPQLEMALRNGM